MLKKTHTFILSLSLMLTACAKVAPTKEYTITFLDDDQKTQLSVIKVKEGEMPVYDKEEPAKQPTEQYEYTFDKWSPDLVAATKDATYVATYTAMTRQYTISFVSEGVTLQSSLVKYGEMPEYLGEEPSKEPTVDKVFSFVGWDKELTRVVGEETYTALFADEPREYTIQFVNGEEVLQSETLSYGDIPVYSGEEPTKEATAEYEYVFKGWDKEITAVTDNETYTAIFHEIDCHGICAECGEFFDAEKIGDYAFNGTQKLEEETPAPGFNNVYGKVGFANGNNGADIDVSKYTSLYFALSHNMSYAILFGGNSENNAVLNRDDWYHVLIERDDNFAWTAFYRKSSEKEWKTALVDGNKDTNLSSLLRIYNWDNEGTNAQIKCSEVYAADRHKHQSDDYGMCIFCGELMNKELAGDCAINGASLTNQVAPRGFSSVYSSTNLSNGNNGSSFNVTSYKTLYFALYHDIASVFVFGGGDDNPVLWKEDWYYILLTKGDNGWVAHYKKSYETSWNTSRTKVDGAKDENFSSILRLYNWSSLSSATIKCTEVYGVVA